MASKGACERAVLWPRRHLAARLGVSVDGDAVVVLRSRNSKVRGHARSTGGRARRGLIDRVERAPNATALLSASRRARARTTLKTWVRTAIASDIVGGRR